MKAQASLEYLIIIGVLLFLVSVLAAQYKNFSDDSGSEVVVSTSLNAFKQVSDSVYALGRPASQSVRVVIPLSVNSSRTYASGRVVQISYVASNGETVDAARFLDYNVTGEFPNVSGSFDVVIRSLGGAGVEVSYS